MPKQNRPGPRGPAHATESETALYTVKDILRMEVAPALGCTEPVAIALAAAAAASLLPGQTLDSLEMWVDPNVYKNGLAVSIPGTPGMSGLDTAAALGALGGDPSLKLEVLEPLNDEIVDRARSFLKQGKVVVNLLQGEHGLHVKAIARAGEHSAEAVIKDLHDNLVSLLRDGEPVVDSPLIRPKGDDGKDDLMKMEEWLKSQSLTDLLALVDELDEEDRGFLEQSAQYNLRLAEHGLKFGPGLGIGKTLQRLVRLGMIKRDMIQHARMLTSAAADARMSGVKLPAMASAGSGNHGLTAVLPIWAMQEFVECSHETVVEAIGFSHLITAYVKAHTGRLSAVCGCSIAAGAGATAGITYLLAGDTHHIAGAVKNLTGDLAGVICDGAKAGCALKLATAAGTAVQAALFALHGVNVHFTDGIIGDTLEQTTQNLGTLSTEGMIETDRTILNIMLKKHFT